MEKTLRQIQSENTAAMVHRDSISPEDVGGLIPTPVLDAVLAEHGDLVRASVAPVTAMLDAVVEASQPVPRFKGTIRLLCGLCGKPKCRHGTDVEVE